MCGIATWVVTGIFVFWFSSPRLLWLPMSAVLLRFSVTVLTQHSSKVQIMIFVMKIDFVFLPFLLSNV